MDFSEAYRFGGPTPVYSPDSRFVASAAEYRLVIRDVESLQVVHLCSCLDRISQIEWSCDGDHVLCALHKRATLQCWSVSQPDWSCKIDEGAAGIRHVRWSPDGHHIIITADFQIRMTIWSLADQKCIHIKGPKFPCKGLAFSPEGDLMAVAERHDCKDFVTIYATKTWKPEVAIAVPTNDLSDVAWSPDGCCLVVWDSSLTYKALVYASNGDLLASYQAYSEGLGIKSVSWSPSGQMLAIGSYDQEARLLNNATWSPLAELSHPANLTEPASVIMYKELEEGQAAENISGYGKAQPPRQHSASEEPRSRFVIQQLPVKLPSQKPPLDKPNPKLGIGRAAWSCDGSHLLTVNDNMGSCAWLWDMEKMELGAVLQQNSSILSISWDPVHLRLALCTGSTKIFLWSPAGASCVHLPIPNFAAHTLTWSPDGASMVLADRDSFCVAYFAD